MKKTLNILKDYDGNKYKTIKIGKQIWTSENFRCTHFNDGKKIPLVTDKGTRKGTWSGLLTPAYCYYNNSTNSLENEKYGALYNWYAVNTGKLAPKGWHVSTDDEWTELEKNFNKDKFSGLPGGYRFYNGTFGDLGSNGYWWSATELVASFAYYRFLFYVDESLNRFSFDKRCGFSVRLVRD